MIERKGQFPARSTPASLIKAANVGARIAMRAALATGADEQACREAVIARFQREIESESFGPFADERLMSAVQEGIEAVVVESRVRAGSALPTGVS